MKLIVITQPFFFDQEATAIQNLLDWGIDLIHIRKPESAIRDCATLLTSIPATYHNRIVLHDHFELTANYQLYGIHLNRRNSKTPATFRGSLSRSCHSLEELKTHKPYFNYLFLSPIFNSISKQGYESAFNHDTLTAAAQQSIIDSRVVALGGVAVENIPLLKAYGFGGAALLGDVWQRLGDPDFKRYILRLVAVANGWWLVESPAISPHSATP